MSGLASMYLAFDWSAGSGPSWISARVHAWSGRSVIHLSLVVHAGGRPRRQGRGRPFYREIKSPAVDGMTARLDGRSK